MVDDFQNYADLNGGATAATIREAADSPSTHASTLQTLVADLADDSKTIRTTIEGDFQDATTMNLKPANEAARRLTQSGLYAVGLLNSLADTVETFDKEVEKLNTELNHNTSTRWQNEHGTTKDNSEAGSGGGDDGPPDLSYADIRAQEKAKLQGRYDHALLAMENEADRVAGLFKGSPDPADVKELVLAGYIPLQLAGVWPNLKLNDEETKQAQLNTVKRMSAAEQVEFVKNTKDIDPAIAEVISPEAQKTLANDVTKDIKDKEIDSDTVRIMNLLKGQDPFAHAVYSNVSPHEMAEAIEELEDNAYPDVGGIHGSTDEKDLYKNFMTAAGTTFATYTKATDEYAPPDDLVDTWYKAITDGEDEDDSAPLTLLIKAGGQETSFDSKFMSELTGKVYEWERDQDGAVWGPRTGDFMDPFADVESSVDAHSGLISYEKGFAVDGLANLLGGMEHSPEAAKDFFHGRYEGIDGDDSRSLDETMDYLVGGEDGRTWDSGDDSDDGDGLGKALAAATVGEDSRTKDGTEIANKLFENIAEHGGKGDGTFTDEWHIGPEMTDSLGVIASGYTSDIYDELSGDGAKNGDTHLDLGDDSRDTLKQVLGELGRPSDKTGLETLTTAMMLQAKAEYGDQLGNIQGPHTIDNLMDAGLEGAQGKSGKVMGLLLTEGLSLASDEDKSAEARAAIMSKAIDVTAGFIPGAGDLLGEGASHLTKATVDTLKGEAIEQLKNGVSEAPDTDSYLDSNVLSLDQKIQTNAIDSLAEHGFLNKQDTENYGPWEGMPKEVLVGDPPHVDPRLYDSDGHNIDTKDMSDAEKEKVKAMQDAWSEYGQSDPSDQVLTITAQSEFMKYFTNPEYTG